MVFKNNDNYDGTKDYILNQLFIYNYNNSDHIQKLKMKLWVLDGDLSAADITAGYIENSVVTPKDHLRSLANELTFLDRYVRTKDNLLTTNEPNFESLKQSRISGMASFIRQINPDTGVVYNNYDMPYSSRPTLLSDSDFLELYTAFKIKQTAGELSTAFDIVRKVTTYCIDTEIKQQEQLIENTPSQEELEVIMVAAGESNWNKNDKHYVTEMISLHNELFQIIKFIEPASPANPYPDQIPDPDWNGVTPPECPIIENPNKRQNTQKLLINCPHIREQVSITDTSTHKGNIVGRDPITFQPGGYRYSIKDVDGVDTTLSTTGVTVSSGSYTIKTGDLENEFDQWFWAYYYEDTVDGTTTKTLELLKAKEDLPATANTAFVVNAKTKARFDELNNRWINLNKLREYQIANSGTRIMVEALVSATAPDLSVDMANHLIQKNHHKDFYTRILREKCSEFI